MAVITCENVTKIYGSGETRIAALDGVDLSVEPGTAVTCRVPPFPEKSSWKF